jgi:hypothetical protein
VRNRQCAVAQAAASAPAELRRASWPPRLEGAADDGGVNHLLIGSLQKLAYFYGDTVRIACPTGSDRLMTLEQVSAELAGRLTRIFLRDGNGRRPVFGEREKLQSDPHWRDLISFYECFHGDTGAGIGASHQTGWTALVAKLLEQAARRV